MALQMNFVDNVTGALLPNAYIVVGTGVTNGDGSVRISLYVYASIEARNDPDIEGKLVLVTCQPSGDLVATDLKNLGYQLIKLHPDFATAIDV